MRAAVLDSCPGELSIADLSVDAVGPHEVLVRTAAAGLCHSDLHFMEGSYVYPTPVVMGHESAGVIEAVGEQVTYVQPGDHVVTCMSVFCGRCEHCLTGRSFLCQSQPSRPGHRLHRHDEPVYQFAELGSFAEQLLVSENAVVKIDPDMPLDRAALLGCGAITGAGAVFNTADVRPGETVAVIGCGGIGLNAIQAARIAGATRVVAVDVVAAKLELARTFGATDLVDASGCDPVAAVAELTLGGVDHAFEAIGMVKTAEQSIGMARRGGAAYIIGMLPMTESFQVSALEMLSAKSVVGCLMGSNRFRVDIPRLADLYLQGRFKLDELISARISLDAVNAGFDALGTGEVARQVVVFD